MHSTDVGADDELSYTTFLFLQFPAFEVDFTSGKVFAGVLIAFLSSILNGTGMAIQGLGHLKVAHFHHLLAALKDCPGDERDRLELALSNPNTFAKYHTGEAARQEGLRRLNEMAANEGPEIKSEEEMDELIGSGGPSNWTNPTWILGFVMAASAGIANNVALAFAPAALIAPIDATVLVVNVCVSPLFLPTKLYIKDYGGATVITMGVAICVLFGPVNNKTWTSAQIMDCWAGTGIQVWTAANAAVWAFCNWRVKRSLARMQDEGTWHPEAGEQLDLTAPGVKWLGIMRCYTAALIGTYTGLFSAATFLALGNTISGVHNNFRITSSCISTTYFTLAMFIGLNIWMEISKQEAIKWFGSVFVVPIYQGFIIIGLVLTCGIFYQDFTGMLSGPIFLFFLGALVTSSGVLWISSQPEEDEGGCGGGQSRNSKKSGFAIMEDPDDNEEVISPAGSSSCDQSPLNVDEINTSISFALREVEHDESQGDSPKLANRRRKALASVDSSRWSVDSDLPRRAKSTPGVARASIDSSGQGWTRASIEALDREPSPAILAHLEAEEALRQLPYEMLLKTAHTLLCQRNIAVDKMIDMQRSKTRATKSRIDREGLADSGQPELVGNIGFHTVDLFNEFYTSIDPMKDRQATIRQRQKSKAASFIQQTSTIEDACPVRSGRVTWDAQSDGLVKVITSLPQLQEISDDVIQDVRGAGERGRGSNEGSEPNSGQISCPTSPSREREMKSQDDLEQARISVRDRSSTE